MHALPADFHRTRYYGFLTSQPRARNIARIRELLAAPLIPVDAIKALDPTPEQPKAPEHPCPCCGGPMRIIEIFLRGQQPSYRASPMPQAIRIDTSITPAPLTNTRNHAHHVAGLCADTAAACVSTQTIWATATWKHFAAPHITPAAQPNRLPGAPILARPKPLPTPRVTSTPKP